MVVQFVFILFTVIVLGSDIVITMLPLLYLLRISMLEKVCCIVPSLCVMLWHLVFEILWFLLE